jgi:hypothetical protein
MLPLLLLLVLLLLLLRSTVTEHQHGSWLLLHRFLQGAEA